MNDDIDWKDRFTKLNMATWEYWRHINRVLTSLGCTIGSDYQIGGGVDQYTEKDGARFDRTPPQWKLPNDWFES